MKRMTKKITFPTGEVVTLSASYEANYDSVRPDVTGPLNLLLSAIGRPGLDEIEGVSFKGWMGIPLRARGCRVEDSEEGAWTIFTE